MRRIAGLARYYRLQRRDLEPVTEGQADGEKGYKHFAVRN